MGRLITQKDVARALGVHPSTISLAFGRSPKIPASTRERIMAAAKKLGYVRDPLLSALSLYRNSRRRRTFRGALAWLTHVTSGLDWRRVPECCQYYRGALRRATELGYSLTIFELSDYAANPSRLMRVMHARNIRGVLVCPQPRSETRLSLDLSEVATVAIGYSVQAPTVHIVATNFYESIRQMMRQLRARGYRRIGYAITSLHNDRVAGYYLAGYLFEQNNDSPKDRLAPYQDTPPNLTSFREWLVRQKPDALITAQSPVPAFLRKLGVTIPDELGVALVSVTDKAGSFAGINEGCETIGGVAVEFLTSLVEHGYRGLPDNPQRLHLQAAWQEGTSVRPLPAD
ncbi:MAG: LacI family DNA-binding transcriptional regulator [Opitutaceae bacterium]|jgi:LacI family transcriptional regulator/LacI family repressor for deo operon, udp, cdd, tsx, nupC, and nupG